jgi:cytochrome c peroxidase
MNYLPILTVVAVGAMTACRGPKETTVVTPTEKTLSAEAQSGQQLFMENCGRCHDLPQLPDYSAERWERIVPPMAKKSNLDATQEKAVMTYVREMLK